MDVVREADREVFANGHPLDYLRASGGPVAYVIRKQLTDLAMHGNGVMIIERVTQRLTDHYQLRDYYPPVSLMREALACMVKLKELITRIHPDFHPVLDELVERSDVFEAASDVLAAPFETIAELAKKIVPESTPFRG